LYFRASAFALASPYSNALVFVGPVLAFSLCPRLGGASKPTAPLRASAQFAAHDHQDLKEQDKYIAILESTTATNRKKVAVVNVATSQHRRP